MTPSSPHPVADGGVAARLAALLDMGFERVEPPPQTTQSARLDARTWKVSQIAPAMGGFVAITALHESRELADEAIGRAFEEMHRLIGLLNRFDAASPLSCLNDAGKLAGAPPELLEVVGQGLAHHRISGGAFDITVKPIIDLYRDQRTYEPIEPPGPAQLGEALELIGPDWIEIGGRDIAFRRAGMGITLDGIAKGYIVDAIATTLERHGARRYLVNAGGDIRTAGTRGDDRPWTVAVRDPEDGAVSWDSEEWGRHVSPPESGGAGNERERSRGPASQAKRPRAGFADTIQLTGGAVATSGSYETYFDRERISHHIVHSRTGASPSRAVSVTVTAPTAMQADALATAAFVLGPRAGVRLIDELPGCACLIIDRDKQRIRSRRWRGTSGAS
jgi:thiamine biosynthesis lipoprotein